MTADLPADVLGLVRHLADRAADRWNYQSACIPHLGYEFYVERPRRAGVDAAYQALMAEALAGAERHHREAS